MIKQKKSFVKKQNEITIYIYLNSAGFAII